MAVNNLANIEDDGFMYGLDRLVFGGVDFGYISEEGLQPNITEAEKVQVRAAQMRNAVVKEFESKAEIIGFSFKLLQLTTAKGWKDAFGGMVDDKGVYAYPIKKDKKEGKMTIHCASGHVIEADKVSLTANLADGLNMNNTLTIECKVTFIVPDGENVENLFKVYPPGAYTEQALTPEEPSTGEGGGVVDPMA